MANVWRQAIVNFQLFERESHIANTNGNNTSHHFCSIVCCVDRKIQRIWIKCKGIFVLHSNLCAYNCGVQTPNDRCIQRKYGQIVITTLFEVIVYCWAWVVIYAVSLLFVITSKHFGISFTVCFSGLGMQTHSKAAPLHGPPLYRQLFHILQLKFHMKFSSPCKCDIWQKKRRMNILEIVQNIHRNVLHCMDCMLTRYYGGF